MPKLSKLIEAPFKLWEGDAYADPTAQRFLDEFRAVMQALGASSGQGGAGDLGFYPAPAYHDGATEEYLALDTPLVVDDALAPGELGLLQVWLPGSVTSVRLDIDADPLMNSSQGGPRAKVLDAGRGQGDTSAGSTASAQNFSNNGWSRQADMQAWLRGNFTPPLGSHTVGFIDAGTAGPYPVKMTVRGAWVRHTPLGLTLYSENGNDPSRRKFVHVRLIPQSGTQFFLRAGSVFSRTFQRRAFDIRYTKASGVGYASGSSSSPGTVPGTMLGDVGFSLDKASDAFLDAAGNTAGWAALLSQNSSYRTPVVVQDFTNPPYPADDGSQYPRWGFVAPNDRGADNLVAYFAHGCPSMQPYYVGFGPGFNAGTNAPSSGYEAPVPSYEVPLGQLLTPGTAIAQAWALRVADACGNRGAAANLYFSKQSAFAGGVGDIWKADSGDQYLCVCLAVPSNSMFQGPSRNSYWYIKL